LFAGCAYYLQPSDRCFVWQILLIREAKEKGLPVTCEVSPQHLFLTEEDLDTIGHGFGQVRPMLATKADQKALWDNLDIIDCFATDHGKSCVVMKIYQEVSCSSAPALKLFLCSSSYCGREAKRHPSSWIPRLGNHAPPPVDSCGRRPTHYASQC